MVWYFLFKDLEEVLKVISAISAARATSKVSRVIVPKQKDDKGIKGLEKIGCRQTKIDRKKRKKLCHSAILVQDLFLSSFESWKYF